MGKRLGLNLVPHFEVPSVQTNPCYGFSWWLETPLRSWHTAKELPGEAVSVALIFSFCLVQHQLNPMEDPQQDVQQGLVTLENCYTGIGTSQGGKEKEKETLLKCHIYISRLCVSVKVSTAPWYFSDIIECHSYTRNLIATIMKASVPPCTRFKLFLPLCFSCLT